MPTDEEIVAVDAGNHRIVRLGRDLEILGAFGSEGGGPAELQTPVSLGLWQGQVVVADVGNARLTFFSRQGEPLRTVPLPADADPGGSFAITGGGRILASSLSDTHYLSMSTSDGGWAAFGRRGAWPKLDQVVATAGDTLYVADSRYGVIVKLHPDTGTIGAYPLPLEMVRKVREEARRVSESLGIAGQGAYTQLPKDFSATRDGKLLLSIDPGDGTIGVLFDPASERMRVIRAPETSPDGPPLSHGSAGVLAGDTLYITSIDGVRSYRMQQDGGEPLRR